MGLTGLYLLAALPAAAAGAARSGSGVALAVTHTAAMLALLWLARRPAAEGWPALWLPLLAIPVLYWEIPLINQTLTAGYHDPVIVGWERALFHAEPARELAGALPFVWLSEPLHAAYLMLYPLIYLPPLMLFVRRKKEAFRTTILGLMLAALVCYLVFVYFPVQGPRYFGPPRGVPDGPVRRLALSVLERGSSRGAAFPSSHVGIMTAQSILALVFQQRLGVAVSIITAALAFGAVYGGFHYGLDALVGGCVGGVAAWGALRIGRAEASTSVSRETAASDMAE